jgi:hypothetical protein
VTSPPGDLAAEALGAALGDRWTRALNAIDTLYRRAGARGIAAFFCAIGDAVAGVVPPGTRTLCGPDETPGSGAAGQEWATRFLAAYLAQGREALTLISDIPAGYSLTFAGAVLSAAATTISQQIQAGWEPPS